MRGVRRVNFRLPLFTWGEVAGSAWSRRGGGGGLRAVQGQERRASARCTGAPATGRSRARAQWVVRGTLSLLTGLEAPLLQLDEARRLEQRVEEAHVGAARPRAVQARPLSRRDWPRAPRAAHVAGAAPANGSAARGARDRRAQPMSAWPARARGACAIDAIAAIECMPPPACR